MFDRQSVRPLVLRDVPAQRLAYRFEADVSPPPGLNEESNDKLAPIQSDFTIRRTDDALLRTVPSPDGQRALALYGTEDEPSSAFRIDMYASDGKFLRNLTPPEFSCVFPEAVTWSPDGNLITFIAHRKTALSPTPTPPPDLTSIPEAAPVASPSIGPAFPAMPVFNTEQIYVCNRDGYELRSVTSREGLIYFYFAWAPDNHALVALACKEAEWDAREKQGKLPAGRLRLISLDGSERLLDDRLTEALPVWSPDASKVATGFESEQNMDIGIYDAATAKPTQARIALRDALIAASLAYEEKTKKKSDNSSGKGNSGSQQSSVSGNAQGNTQRNAQGNSAGQQQGVASSTPRATLPPSFNPIVRLEWPSPDKLYFQTAYVRLLTNETINTFQRWHLLVLSPQATLLR